MGGVFRYANPPVVRWGDGSVGELAGELQRLDVRRPAIVTTRSVAAEGGALAAVRRAMPETPEVAVALIGQHAPVREIEAAAAVLSPADPDGIVSVGGGSPIDAAKMIGLDVARAAGRERLPHVAIPTTLSVAELAGGAGFTDAEGNKVGRRDEGLLPDAVIYDGALALLTPLPLWLSTGIRALDHAVEGYLARGEHPLSDVLAVESIRRLFASLPAAMRAPSDAGIRTQNQLAAWFGFTLPGPSAAGLSHMLGKQVGARFAIPHGVTSCVLLPHVVRYRGSLDAEGERVVALARATGVADDADGFAAAIERLVAELGLPHRLGSFGLDDRDLVAAAEAQAGEFAAADLLAIYRAAR